MSKPVRFPRSIKIQNQTWTVEFCNITERLELMGAEPEELHDEAGQAVLGFCDVARRTICVEETMSVGSKAEVLAHEIFHAFFGVMPHGMGPELDEQIAKFGATALLDLLLNNNLDWVEAGA